MKVKDPSCLALSKATPNLKSVIVAVASIAKDMGHEYLSCTHLLLAMIREKNPCQQLFIDGGVVFEDVKNELYPPTTELTEEKMKVISYSFGGSCPTQLEAELEGGLFLYARYRNGNFGFGISSSQSKACDIALQNKKKIGEDYDGVMSLEDMIKNTNLDLDFSNAKEN